MSIAFERQGSELVLTLAPERIFTHEILDVLNKGEEWRISRSFTVTKKHFRSEDTDQNELQFCIGTVYDEYTLIDSDVLGTEHGFPHDEVWPSRVATGVVDDINDCGCMVCWDNPIVVGKHYNGRTHVWYEDIAKVIPWD